MILKCNGQVGWLRSSFKHEISPVYRRDNAPYIERTGAKRYRARRNLDNASNGARSDIALAMTSK
jgi:hypothetical protein